MNVMVHLMKASLGLLGFPLVVAFLVLTLAVACQLRRRLRAAYSLYVTAILVTYLASIRLVGSTLLHSLEDRYPALSDSQPRVGYVVVLGSDYRPRPGIYLTAALDADGLVRILEGIRLMRRIGAAHLVVSGGAPHGGAPSAFGYGEFARQFGVPQDSIVPIPAPLDTHEEAHAVARLLGPVPFLLVTSAYHMPRAMKLMERAGAHPIAAPVGQRAGKLDGDPIQGLIPASAGLYQTEHALHEYMGLLAIALGLD